MAAAPAYTVTTPLDEALAVEFQFNFIKQDDAIIALFVQSLIDAGSLTKGLTQNDLKVYRPSSDTPMKTIKDFLIQGNYLFDSILYLSVPVENREKLDVFPANWERPDNNAKHLARCMFVLYFFVLTQANVPDISKLQGNTRMPKFLSNVLHLNESADYYLRNLSTFNLVLMDHRWVRYVTFKGMSAEACARFSLGIAGYRMFAPFRYFSIKEGASEKVRRAVEIVVKFIGRGFFWEVHPYFKSAEVTKEFGSLNDTLGNLMLEAFTDEDLAIAVKSKMIYAKPTHMPRSNGWIGWKESTFKIFKDEVKIGN